MSTVVDAGGLKIDVALEKLDELESLALRNALAQSAALVEAKAKENLISGGHVKTGELVGSIKYRVGDESAEVYTNVPYATYVEFGTGTYAENGDGRPGWWVYVDEKCGAPKSKKRTIYTYEEACRVWHILANKYGPENVYITNGQKPTRFLRDALEKSADEINNLIKNSVNAGVK